MSQPVRMVAAAAVLVVLSTAFSRIACVPLASSVLCCRLSQECFSRCVVVTSLVVSEVLWPIHAASPAGVSSPGGATLVVDVRVVRGRVLLRVCVCACVSQRWCRRSHVCMCALGDCLFYL